jgi:hypothetical protein
MLNLLAWILALLSCFFWLSMCVLLLALHRMTSRLMASLGPIQDQLPPEVRSLMPTGRTYIVLAMLALIMAVAGLSGPMLPYGTTWSLVISGGSFLLAVICITRVKPQSLRKDLGVLPEGMTGDAGGDFKDVPNRKLD